MKKTNPQKVVTLLTFAVLVSWLVGFIGGRFYNRGKLTRCERERTAITEECADLFLKYGEIPEELLK